MIDDVGGLHSLARNPNIAEDALERIMVEYRPLPPIVNPEVATQPDAPLLHPTGSTAPTNPPYPTEPLVSYQINRQFSGWFLPPQVIRAFRAHCQKLTYGSRAPRPTPETAIYVALQPSGCIWLVRGRRCWRPG